LVEQNLIKNEKYSIIKLEDSTYNFKKVNYRSDYRVLYNALPLKHSDMARV